MVFKKASIIFFFLIVLTVFASLANAATETSVTAEEIVENKKLKRHLEDLKDHLEEAIEKLDHNIKVRQAVFADVQTPDDEYIEAIVRQRNDLIAAAARSESPLPSQAMRINQNSGLRRRRSNYMNTQ